MLNKNKILMMAVMSAIANLPSGASAQTFYQCMPKACGDGEYFNGVGCIKLPKIPLICEENEVKSKDNKSCIVPCKTKTVYELYSDVPGYNNVGYVYCSVNSINNIKSYSMTFCAGDVFNYLKQENYCAGFVKSPKSSNNYFNSIEDYFLSFYIKSAEVIYDQSLGILKMKRVRKFNTEPDFLDIGVPDNI